MVVNLAKERITRDGSEDCKVRETKLKCPGYDASSAVVIGENEASRAILNTFQERGVFFKAVLQID